MEVTPSIRRRITITLFLAQSFFSAALIASFTLLPILGAQLSGSDSAAGVPSTVSLLGRALAAYPIGWLMDRVGRRIGLSFGYAAGTVGLALATWAILAGSFLWLLVGVGLFGMGQAASELGRYVAAEIQVPARRAKAMGWIVSAGTIGAVGGPLLVEPSGSLVARFGLMDSAGPFVAGTVLTAVGLGLIWTLMRPDPKSSQTGGCSWRWVQ
jgi:MFS family permease